MTPYLGGLLDRELEPRRDSGVELLSGTWLQVLPLPVRLVSGQRTVPSFFREPFSVRQSPEQEQEVVDGALDVGVCVVEGRHGWGVVLRTVRGSTLPFVRVTHPPSWTPDSRDSPSCGPRVTFETRSVRHVGICSISGTPRSQKGYVSHLDSNTDRPVDYGPVRLTRSYSCRPPVHENRSRDCQGHKCVPN